jgi:glutathione S-transferase
VEATYLRRPADTLVAQLVVAPLFGQRVDSMRVMQARSALRQTLDVLDRALIERSYLAADRFTLAELVYLPSLHALEEARELELAERPALTAWWQRIRARASWQRVLGLRSAEPSLEARGGAGSSRALDRESRARRYPSPRLV